MAINTLKYCAFLLLCNKAVADTDTWADKTHDTVSTKVQSIAQSLDKYLSDEEPRTDNDTYLSLEYGLSFLKNGDIDDKPKVRGKLDLPNTKQKLKLNFSSGDKAQQPLDEKILSSREDIALRRDESSLELETGYAELTNWQRRWRFGARLNSGLDGYIKLEFKRLDPINEDWYTQTRQTFSYYHSKSWGSNTLFEIKRPIQNHSLFNSASEIQFFDSEDKFELAQSLAFATQLSDVSIGTAKIGVIGESQPTWRTRDYFISYEYERKWLRDWFYVTLKPELVFPREDHFKLNPSFTIKAKVIFE